MYMCHHQVAPFLMGNAPDATIVSRPEGRRVGGPAVQEVAKGREATPLKKRFDSLCRTVARSM